VACEEGERYRTGPRTESVRRRPVGASHTPAPSGEAVEQGTLLQAVKEELDRVRALAGEVRAQADVVQTRGSKRGDRRRQEAQEEARRARATTGNRVAQTVVQTRSMVSDLVKTLSPGPAAWSLEDPRWQDLPTIEVGGPTAVRAGRLRLPAGKVLHEAVELPFLVPLLDASGLVIDVDEASRSGGEAMIRAALLRLLAAAPPGAVEVSWFDPQLHGRLASFVSELQNEELVHSALVDPDQLESALTDLTNALVKVTEQRGGVHATLSALNAAAGQIVEPHRIMVIMDHPNGLTERTSAQLARLALQGAASGVTVVILHVAGNAASTSPRDLAADVTDLSRLAPNATKVHGRHGRWCVTGFDHLVLDPDDDPSETLITSVARQLRDAAATAAAPRLPIDELLPDSGQRGQTSSSRGITVPVGRAGTERCSFTLGDPVEQNHNVLVGGAIGQGKSNLLLVMVYGIAARYGPDEVEFQLLDFKEGVEFRPLAGTSDHPWSLPHARVLGLDSDRAFGREVLRGLTAEFHRRAEQFKAVEANSLQAFRERQPHTRMPRIIAVIDEVQVLFDGDDAITEECAQLLDQIARKGRAYGIHLVLGSQTLSGIGGLVTKLDAILAQFGVRLALKTNRSESQVLLEQSNTAAAELRYRGEVIVNTETGSSDANVRAVVAHAQETRVTGLRRELWKNAGSPEPPYVFEGGSPASIDAVDPAALAALERQQSPVAWTGQPVGLTRMPLAFSLDAEPGRHLAFIGREDSEAPAALTVAAATAARSTPDARVVVVDAAPTDATSSLTALVAALRARGRDVTHHDSRDATDALGDIGHELERRADRGEGPTILLVVAAPERIPKLEQFDLDSGTRPGDALRAVVRDGALHGVHLLGWWGGYRSLAEQVDGNLDTAGLLHGLAFVEVPRTNVADALGPMVDWEPARHRGLVADRRHADGGRLVVPFEAPTPEELEWLLTVRSAE
jgi:hypothetical protein